VIYYLQGQPVKLMPKTEECVVLYLKNQGKAIENKKVYDDNFWKDWIKVSKSGTKRWSRYTNL
jgi:hypothetical protein